MTTIDAILAREQGRDGGATTNKQHLPGTSYIRRRQHHCPAPGTVRAAASSLQPAFARGCSSRSRDPSARVSAAAQSVSRPMGYCTCWTAALAAVVLGLLGAGLPLLLQPLALDSSAEALADPSMTLGEGGYDIVPIDAPAAAGPALQALAWLFSRRALGPLLARGLLNQNGVWRLRELAAQVPEHVVQRYLPLHRVTAAEYDAHSALASASPTANALSPLREIRESQGGAPSHTAPIDGSLTSVEDLAKQYEAGETSPSAVAEAALALIQESERTHGKIFTEVQAERCVRCIQAVLYLLQQNSSVTRRLNMHVGASVLPRQAKARSSGKKSMASTSRV
jgi:HAMP domain-containing protein